MKTKILSVTIHDCEVQHFSSGGKGGQNQNKRHTGTRVIHHPSGARGESREERSQLQNKRTAFVRMAKSPKFKIWLAKKTLETASTVPIEDVVLDESDIKVEIRVDGRWVDASRPASLR
jgi:protein subunit release factor A